MTTVEAEYSSPFISAERVPLTANIVEYKVGLFRSQGRLGRAVQAVGTAAIPGDLSPVRSPVRSTIQSALFPGGGSGGGRIGRSIGNAAQRVRCPSGTEFGGRFANADLSNCGRRLFEQAASSAARAVERAGNAGRGAVPNLPGSPNAPRGVVRSIDGTVLPLRAIQISRNASIPKVGALKAAQRESGIDTAASEVAGDVNQSVRLVRRDGVALKPVVSLDILRTIRKNDDMDNGAIVANVKNPATMGKDEIPLLINTGISSAVLSLGNGASLRVDKDRPLTIGERRKLSRAWQSLENAEEFDYSSRLSQLADASEALTFSSRFPGIAKPMERLSIQNADGQVRNVPRWVFEFYLSQSAPYRGNKEPWQIVVGDGAKPNKLNKTPQATPGKKTLENAGRSPLADSLLLRSSQDAWVNSVDFKVASFVNEKNYAGYVFETKRAAAMWDPDLPPSGGWRCPPGTRYGGRITDRFGRNCGYTISRRIAQGLEGLGRAIGEGLDKRRDRRVAARGARVDRRIRRQEGRVERAQARLDRLRAQRIAPGVAGAADRAGLATRLERFADRVDGGTGRRRQRRGAAGEQGGRSRRLARRRRQRSGPGLATRLERFADRMDGGRVRRPRQRRGREGRQRPGLATRLDRLADRIDFGYGREEEAPTGGRGRRDGTRVPAPRPGGGGGRRPRGRDEDGGRTPAPGGGTPAPGDRTPAPPGGGGGLRVPNTQEQQRRQAVSDRNDALRRRAKDVSAQFSTSDKQTVENALGNFDRRIAAALNLGDFDEADRILDEMDQYIDSIEAAGFAVAPNQRRRPATQRPATQRPATQRPATQRPATQQDEAMRRDLSNRQSSIWDRAQEIDRRLPQEQRQDFARSVTERQNKASNEIDAGDFDAARRTLDELEQFIRDYEGDGRRTPRSQGTGRGTPERPRTAQPANQWPSDLRPVESASRVQQRTDLFDRKNDLWERADRIGKTFPFGPDGLEPFNSRVLDLQASSAEEMNNGDFDAARRILDELEQFIKGYEGDGRRTPRSRRTGRGTPARPRTERPATQNREFDRQRAQEIEDRRRATGRRYWDAYLAANTESEDEESRAEYGRLARAVLEAIDENDYDAADRAFKDMERFVDKEIARWQPRQLNRDEDRNIVQDAINQRNTVRRLKLLEEMSDDELGEYQEYWDDRIRERDTPAARDRLAEINDEIDRRAARQILDELRGTSAPNVANNPDRYPPEGREAPIRPSGAEVPENLREILEEGNTDLRREALDSLTWNELRALEARARFDLQQERDNRDSVNLGEDIGFFEELLEEINDERVKRVNERQRENAPNASVARDIRGIAEQEDPEMRRIGLQVFDDTELANYERYVQDLPNGNDKTDRLGEIADEKRRRALPQRARNVALVRNADERPALLQRLSPEDLNAYADNYVAKLPDGDDKNRRAKEVADEIERRQAEQPQSAVTQGRRRSRRIANTSRIRRDMAGNERDEQEGRPVERQQTAVPIFDEDDPERRRRALRDMADDELDDYLFELNNRRNREGGEDNEARWDELQRVLRERGRAGRGTSEVVPAPNQRTAARASGVAAGGNEKAAARISELVRAAGKGDLTGEDNSVLNDFMLQYPVGGYYDISAFRKNLAGLTKRQRAAAIASYERFENNPLVGQAYQSIAREMAQQAQEIDNHINEFLSDPSVVGELADLDNAQAKRLVNFILNESTDLKDDDFDQLKYLLDFRDYNDLGDALNSHVLQKAGLFERRRLREVSRKERRNNEARTPRNWREKVRYWPGRLRGFMREREENNELAGRIGKDGLPDVLTTPIGHEATLADGSKLKVNNIDDAATALRGGAELIDIPDEFLFEAMSAASTGANVRFDRREMLGEGINGGANNQFMFTDIRDGRRYIVKYNEYSSTRDEDLAEVLGNNVAARMGFPVGVVRFAGPNRVPAEDHPDFGYHNQLANGEFIPAEDAIGRPILIEHVENYVDGDTLDPEIYVNGEMLYLSMSRDDMIRATVLDYLIVNSDRHPGNFFVVEQDGEYRFAPIDPSLGFGGFGGFPDHMADIPGLMEWLGHYRGGGRNRMLERIVSEFSRGRIDRRRVVEVLTDIQQGMKLAERRRNIDGFIDDMLEVAGSERLPNPGFKELFLDRYDAFLDADPEDLADAILSGGDAIRFEDLKNNRSAPPENLRRPPSVPSMPPEPRVRGMRIR